MEPLTSSPAEKRFARGKKKEKKDRFSSFTCNKGKSGFNSREWDRKEGGRMKGRAYFPREREEGREKNPSLSTEPLFEEKKKVKTLSSYLKREGGVSILFPMHRKGS